MKKWDLMCNVDSIHFDVVSHTGELFTPELNFPNMMSTIDMFRSIDPDIERIFVYENRKLDLMYFKNEEGKWDVRGDGQS